ncbi:MAG TPA: rhomboid family intramembrane serine protease [Pseudonocardia sp.]|jgi:membrane associated rhomboid family serine protease|nr:rhomboid family intramembrane serine protease [Pseudonocardia sp.]
MSRADWDYAPARLLPPRPFLAAAFMLAATVLLYAVEVQELASGDALEQNYCIIGRDDNHLIGILVAPLLHAGWDHLLGNTLAFLLFGFLAMADGFARFVGVTAMVWLVSGLGVWVFGPPVCTVGVSGVIFGWLLYLLFRGFYARSGRQIALAVVLIVMWGGVLWGVLPGQPGISWQAHLFGALGGILAARLLARPAWRRRPEEPVMRQ